MIQLLEKIKKLPTFLDRTDGSMRDKTIRAGTWVGISTVLNRFMDFVRSVVLARLLMPEVFGLMAIAIVLLRGIQVFTKTGFQSALIHRQTNVDEAVHTAWMLTILRGFVLAGITVVAAPFAAAFFDQPVLDLVIRIIAVTFIIEGFRNVHLVILQKEMNFKLLTYFQLAGNAINLVCVVILAYIYRNVWALVIAHMFAYFVSTTLSYIMVPKKPKFRFNKKIAWELFHYGKFVTGVGIVVFLSTQMDNAVVGKVLGMKTLGYYAMAYTIANLPTTQITHLISQIMFPAYSKLQNDLSAVRDAYLKVLRVVATFAIPAAAGIGLLAPEIVRVVYGEKWLPAVPALQILVVYGLSRSIMATVGPVFFGTGKPHLDFYVSTIRVLLIAITIYPLTKHYGIAGTALSVTISMIINQCAYWYLLKNQLNCSIVTILRQIFCPLISTLGMIAILILVENYALWTGLCIAASAKLFSNILLGFLTYGIIYSVLSLPHARWKFSKLF